MVALSNLQVRTKSVIYRLRWCWGGGGEEGRKEAGGLGREIEEESVHPQSSIKGGYGKLTAS